jgi:hypothetical protein
MEKISVFNLVGRLPYFHIDISRYVPNIDGRILLILNSDGARLRRLFFQPIWTFVTAGSWAWKTRWKTNGEPTTKTKLKTNLFLIYSVSRLITQNIQTLFKRIGFSTYPLSNTGAGREKRYVLIRLQRVLLNTNTLSPFAKAGWKNGTAAGRFCSRWTTLSTNRKGVKTRERYRYRKKWFKPCWLKLIADSVDELRICWMNGSNHRKQNYNNRNKNMEL